MPLPCQKALLKFQHWLIWKLAAFVISAWNQKQALCINGIVRTHSIWATTWQNQQSDRAPSKGSDQLGHPPRLIRVFAVHMKKAWVLSYSYSAQPRLWSDWEDAQADLSLRWAHSHFVGFVMSRLISISSEYSKDHGPRQSCRQHRQIVWRFEQPSDQWSYVQPWKWLCGNITWTRRSQTRTVVGPVMSSLVTAHIMSHTCALLKAWFMMDSQNAGLQT